MPGLGLGLGIATSRKPGNPFGPELISIPAGTGWTTTGTGVSTTSGALVYSSGGSLSGLLLAIPSTEDNATYQITWTLSSYSSGTARVIIYGATANHLGIGPSRSGNGNYTETLVTSTSGSSTVNRILFQGTGAAGTNTFNITSVSMKKVL